MFYPLVLHRHLDLFLSFPHFLLLSRRDSLPDPHPHPPKQTGRQIQKEKKKSKRKARSQPWQHPNRRMLKDHNMAVGLAQAISKELKHLLSKWPVTSTERTCFFFFFFGFFAFAFAFPFSRECSLVNSPPHTPHTHTRCQNLKAVNGTKTKFMT